MAGVENTKDDEGSTEGVDQPMGRWSFVFFFGYMGSSLLRTGFL